MIDEADESQMSERLGQRRISVRPLVLAVAVCCLAIGTFGFIITRNNFTFLPQDGDQLPQSYWDAQNAKQPWMDFGCSMLPIGLVGLLLLVFSFRVTEIETGHKV